MYLMDLAFIEESTPDFVEGNLINFSKLRMVYSFIFTKTINPGCEFIVFIMIV
jgi:hypothetical protein